jgi:hypothetical protein
MRITTLVCVCASALFASESNFAFDAIGQTFPTITRGAPSSGASTVEMKSSSDPAVARERDPAERSARSIEWAQRADARGLQGKTRKHFVHECKNGV